MLTVALVCVTVGPLCVLAMLALLLIGCGPDPRADVRSVEAERRRRDALARAEVARP